MENKKLAIDQKKKIALVAHDEINLITKSTTRRAGIQLFQEVLDPPVKPEDDKS